MNKETTSLKKEEITRKWYVVDAAGKTLGRLASDIAIYLMGKEKPSWTPNQDCGDYVIVINCEKVKVNGGHKPIEKNYYNVSGYNGGMRIRTLKVMLESYPEELFERVVWGMLPKGRLGRKIAKKLFVYKGADHKHQAQNPEVLEFANLGGNK
jgi:large subunit ribosomal protein L13